MCTCDKRQNNICLSGNFDSPYVVLQNNVGDTIDKTLCQRIFVRHLMSLNDRSLVKTKTTALPDLIQDTITPHVSGRFPVESSVSPLRGDGKTRYTNTVNAHDGISRTANHASDALHRYKRVHDRDDSKQIEEKPRETCYAEQASLLTSTVQATDPCSLFKNSMARVKQCGFYYGALSMCDAKQLLRRASVGSFILRNSSVSDFMLSLSVKTARGTTSLRIHLKQGAFMFDCVDTARTVLPSCHCILKLLEYYVECSRTNTQRCVFLESSGRKDTPVLLLKPFMRQPQDLKHLVRVRLNNILTDDNKKRILLFMKPEIENFLLEYPYKI